MGAVQEGILPKEHFPSPLQFTIPLLPSDPPLSSASRIQAALPSSVEALQLVASRPSRTGPPAALWALHAINLIAASAGVNTRGVNIIGVKRLLPQLVWTVISFEYRLVCHGC